VTLIPTTRRFNMSNGYNVDLDKIIGPPAKLKRSNNEKESFFIAIRDYDGQGQKIEFARLFHSNNGTTYLAKQKVDTRRLSADEARRIGKTLCAAADVILGAEALAKGKKTRKAKGKKTRKAKNDTKQDTSPLIEDVQAAEDAQLLLGNS
jgi:hypothetical protein